MIDRVEIAKEHDPFYAYWLIELTDKQFVEEEYWHDLFCREVGSHFDFTGRSSLAEEEFCVEDFFRRYNSRPMPDYIGNKVVGWFRLAAEST